VDANELDWRQALDAQSADTDQLLEIAEQALAESRARRGESKTPSKDQPKPVRLGEDLSRWLNDFEAEQKDPEVGRIAISGIKSLDTKLKMRAGELTIIAARPGMGKSMLASNIAMANAKRGAPVMVFSLEMSKDQWTGRIISSQSGVCLNRQIQDGDWSKLAKACGELHEWQYWIDDRAGLSAKQMRSALFTLPAVRLIVVDYLGLMAEDKNAGRHDIAVGNNAKDLRALAKDYRAHVLCLCQLNRDVEKRKPSIPMLSDLRDSGNLEEHADNVLMIYRDGYYNHDVDDDTAQLQIEKQRQGQRGVVKVSWSGKTQTFADLDNEPPPRSPPKRYEPLDWKNAAAGDSVDQGG
jgi:replicative DNA helicase